MFQVKVTSNLKKAERKINNYSRVIDKATTKALNRTAVTVKKIGNQTARKIYNVKSKEIDKYLKVTRATWSRQIVLLVWEARRRTWRFFQGKLKMRKGKPKGMTAKVKKRGPKFYAPTGFFMEKGGNKFALFRFGKGKKDIKRLTGPSVAQIMSNKEVVKDMIKKKKEVFPKYLKDAFKFFNK